jgi:uncharacterized protein YegL
MTNSAYTHLALIIDRSGSMQKIRSDMEGAIKALLAEQAALPGELHIDVTRFDTAIEHLHTDVRADDVKGEIISPRGFTALNDAIGVTVHRLGERLSLLPEEERPGKVVVAIVTDGYENSSKEWSTKAVKDLVEKQQTEFSWEFLFLGASSIDAFAVAEGYGIPHHSTVSFADSALGAAGAMQAASSYLTRSRVDGATEFTEAERKAAEAR